MSCAGVFKGANDPAVYILVDNKKCHVPNQECFNRIFRDWDVITVLNDDIVDSIPTGEPLDTKAVLVKPSDDAPVYLLSHGVKRWIPSQEKFEYFGFSWDNIQELDSIFIDQYETGDQL